MKRDVTLVVVFAALLLSTFGVMILGCGKVLAEDERQVKAAVSGSMQMSAVDIAPFNWN